MNTELYHDPEFESLVRIITSGDCIAFIGSGLSTSNYPSWDNLIIELCQKCDIPVPSIAPGQKIDPAILMQLADEAKQRNSGAYCEVLAKQFGKPVVQTRRAYDLLMRLPFKGFITINFDPLLATESRKPEFKCNGVYKFPSLPSHMIEHRSVFYLHGYIAENTTPGPDEIILGSNDFLRAYEDANSLLPSFLTQLLTFHHILFIGCGLREEPLKRIFNRCYQIRRQIEIEYVASAPSRYSLQPMHIIKTEKEELVRNLEFEKDENKRFEEFEIKVLRYHPKDEEHSAIEEILEKMISLKPVDIRSGFEGVL